MMDRKSWYRSHPDHRDRCDGQNHCWHLHTGPLLMVVPEGHVVEKCCQHPEATRLVHVDHLEGWTARHTERQLVVLR